MKLDIGYYAYHNGSWGPNPLSDNKDVWSCCMMEKKTGEVYYQIFVGTNSS